MERLELSLPGSVAKPLARLRRDLESDLKAVLGESAKVEDEESKEFVYHWALANSRSFAWKPAKRKVGAMVMCPVLDFVNHCAFASGEAVSRSWVGDRMGWIG